MTKEEIKKILKGLCRWRDVTEKWNNGLKNFSEIIAPDCYAPFMGITFEEAYKDAICTIYPKMEEDLSYFLYEAPGMKGGAWIRFFNGMEFNAQDIDSFTDYLFITHFSNEK